MSSFVFRPIEKHSGGRGGSVQHCPVTSFLVVAAKLPAVHLSSGVCMLSNSAGTEATPGDGLRAIPWPFLSSLFL